LVVAPILEASQAEDSCEEEQKADQTGVPQLHVSLLLPKPIMLPLLILMPRLPLIHPLIVLQK
jgi:hypothetical protein